MVSICVSDVTFEFQTNQTKMAAKNKLSETLRDRIPGKKKHNVDASVPRGSHIQSYPVFGSECMTRRD
jgi:hypothetical protein